MPDSPHTISSKTKSSVATNTSRVSPTLCHILERERRATGSGQRGQAGSRRARSGFSGGRRALPGTTERGGRSGRGRPFGSAPRGRSGAEADTRPPGDQAAPRHSEEDDGERWAAGRPCPLIAPGDRRGGAPRPRQRPDAPPWLTPHAQGSEYRESTETRGGRTALAAAHLRVSHPLRRH